MSLALCVLVVLVNLQMGPPVNLTLITNSTKMLSASVSSESYMPVVVEQHQQKKSNMNGAPHRSPALSIEVVDSPAADVGAKGNEAFYNRKMIIKDRKIAESITDLPE